MQPASTVISAEDFPACAGLLDLPFIAVALHPFLVRLNVHSSPRDCKVVPAALPSRAILAALKAELSPGSHCHKSNAGYKRCSFSISFPS